MKRLSISLIVIIAAAFPAAACCQEEPKKDLEDPAKSTANKEGSQPIALESLFPKPGAAPRGPFTLHIKGTNFQLQVWQALLRIPVGTLTTYGAIARHLDKPSASRAVGQAVG